MKRKRGRPKGTKKKPCRDLVEGKADLNDSTEHALQKEDENKNSKHCVGKEGILASCRFSVVIQMK